MPTCWETYPLDELVRNDFRSRFRHASRVTLSNTASPAFLRSSFKNIDYDIFLPVLQLATLEIDTPALMGHYSAICLATPRNVPYQNGKGSYDALFKMSEPLSKDAISRIRQFFKALGPHLRFQHEHSPGSSGTCARFRQQLKSHMFPVRCAGSGSLISISTTSSEALLEAVERYKQNPESKQVQDELFATYFELAQIIVHELAHAVSNARFGNRQQRCFPYEDHIFCEEGHDAVSELFDGIITRKRGIVLVRDWPAPDVVERSLRECEPITTSTGSIGALTSKKVSNVWRMPPCFVRAAFQDDFWRTVAPKLGSATLKSPRLLGDRVAPERLGSIADCNCVSCAWMKEYILRAQLRGNSELPKRGRCVNEVVEAQSRRLDKKNSSRVFMPDHKKWSRTPGANCMRGNWVMWMGRLSAKDPRKRHIFGLPPGFKSFVEGTVFAVEAFQRRSG